MVLNKIEKLIEKYENGETTLEEEAQLKDYFSQETVAPHLQHYKAMFNYFSFNQQETFTKQLPLKTKTKFNYKWLSVAAVIALMVGFYFNQNETITEQDKQDYEKAKSYLQLVSQTLNKGAKQVEYLTAINQAGKQVNYLKEMNNPIERIYK